jgi:hypothetical protein
MGNELMTLAPSDNPTDPASLPYQSQRVYQPSSPSSALSTGATPYSTSALLRRSVETKLDDLLGGEKAGQVDGSSKLFALPAWQHKKWRMYPVLTEKLGGG